MSFFFKSAKTASKINIPAPMKTKLLALLVKTSNALADMRKSSKTPSTGLQELGVETGQSTFALERVVSLSQQEGKGLFPRLERKACLSKKKRKPGNLPRF